MEKKFLHDGWSASKPSPSLPREQQEAENEKLLDPLWAGCDRPGVEPELETDEDGE